MTNRVDQINAHALKHLKRVLKRLDKKTLSEEEFVGRTYAYMIAAQALGYSVGAIGESAIVSGYRLTKELDDELQD